MARKFPSTIAKAVHDKLRHKQGSIEFDLKDMENIATGDIDIHQLEKKILAFINIFEKSFDDLKSDQEYFKHQQLITQFFTLSMLYHINDRHMKPRDNRREVRHLNHFFEKIILDASEQGAFGTAFAMLKVLQSPLIARLDLNSEFIVPSTIAKTSQEKEWEVFQTRQPRTSIYTSEDPIHGFLHQLYIHKIIVDGQLNEDKLQQLLSNASYSLKPQVYKEYVVNEFKSIVSLKKQLVFWYNRVEDFHLTDPKRHTAMVNFLLEKARKDHNLSHFQDCLDVLDLIALIDQSQGRSYKNDDEDFARILALYRGMIGKILRTDPMAQEVALDQFFSNFNKNPRVKVLKQTDSEAMGLFSPRSRAKEIANDILKYQHHFSNVRDTLRQERSQAAYTRLLQDMLEGKQAQTLPLPKAKGQLFQGRTTLLPETEYDVPSAEPEHPTRIGINRTMSFIPSQKERSLLQSFATEELKKDFLREFPWALTLDNVHLLGKAHYSADLNLVGIAKLSPKMQLNIVRVVLVSLDLLSKISGYHGELVIQNFVFIKDILDKLESLAALLKKPRLNEPTPLSVSVKSIINELIILNKEYYEMRQAPDAPHPVQANPNMNGFCHLNERLAYLLSGIEFQKSVLKPKTPPVPYEEEINSALTRHKPFKKIQ